MHDKDDPKLEVIVNLNPSSSSQMSQGEKQQKRIWFLFFPLFMFFISDPLSLSGGESSFSTVALLLALWEVIDTPFRIMDEFDIFMDSHHRQKSILMLIEFARTAPHRQFIFLSPLDHNAIPKNQSDIKIKVLDAPNRKANGRQMQIPDYAGN